GAPVVQRATTHRVLEGVSQDRALGLRVVDPAPARPQVPGGGSRPPSTWGSFPCARQTGLGRRGDVGPSAAQLAAAQRRTPETLTPARPAVLRSEAMVGARGFVGFTVLVASLVGCSNEPSMAEALQKAAAEDQAEKAA